MESHNTTEFNPGPLDCTVLTRQKTHLSEDVWNNGGNKILACRRSAGSFWKLVDTNPIHLRVLQVWVWERLSIFRQDLRKPKHVIVVPDNFPEPPRAYRWSVHLSWKKVAQHVLSMFRDQLDSLVEEQFVWEPYGANAMQDFCYIWLAMVPLLCWDVVEMYHPDRVLRQFGMRQLIPEASCIELLHEKSDRRSRPNHDWGRQHAKHIEAWNNRANRVYHAEMADGPLHISDPYIRWYRRITRLIIGNPKHRAQQPYHFQGPSSEAMVRSLHMIRQSGNILRGREDTEDIGTTVVDLCDGGLTAAGQIERIVVEPDYTPSQDGPNIPNVHRRRRAGGRGRRRNVDQTEANDGAGTSTMRGEHLDDIGSQQFQQPIYDFPASSTQFSGGSGLHYHRGENFVYHTTPPAEHSPLPNIYGDGFDDDPMQESLSRPDRHVEYNNSPIFSINYESQITNVGSTEGEAVSETITFSQLSNVTRTYQRRVLPARNRRRPPMRYIIGNQVRMQAKSIEG